MSILDDIFDDEAYDQDGEVVGDVACAFVFAPVDRYENAPTAVSSGGGESKPSTSHVSSPVTGPTKPGASETGPEPDLPTDASPASPGRVNSQTNRVTSGEPGAAEKVRQENAPPQHDPERSYAQTQAFRKALAGVDPQVLKGARKAASSGDLRAARRMLEVSAPQQFGEAMQQAISAGKKYDEATRLTKEQPGVLGKAKQHLANVVQGEVPVGHNPWQRKFDPATSIPPGDWQGKLADAYRNASTLNVIRSAAERMPTEAGRQAVRAFGQMLDTYGLIKPGRAASSVAAKRQAIRTSAGMSAALSFNWLMDTGEQLAKILLPVGAGVAGHLAGGPEHGVASGVAMVPLVYLSWAGVKDPRGVYHAIMERVSRTLTGGHKQRHAAVDAHQVMRQLLEMSQQSGEPNIFTATVMYLRSNGVPLDVIPQMMERFVQDSPDLFRDKYAKERWRDQPREPEGSSKGGQWTSAVAGAKKLLGTNDESLIEKTAQQMGFEGGKQEAAEWLLASEQDFKDMVYKAEQDGFQVPAEWPLLRQAMAAAQYMVRKDRALARSKDAKKGVGQVLSRRMGRKKGNPWVRIGSFLVTLWMISKMLDPNWVGGSSISDLDKGAR